MYIAPILVKARAHTDLKQVWLFLERNGSHLIQLDTSSDPIAAAKDFLSTNEMTALGEPVVVDDIVFVTIDPNSNQLDSFYTWREVPVGTIPSKEVWRSFLWLSNEEQSDPLGVNTLLNTIPLADNSHSAFSVVSSYLKTCY